MGYPAPPSSSINLPPHFLPVFLVPGDSPSPLTARDFIGLHDCCPDRDIDNRSQHQGRSAQSGEAAQLEVRMEVVEYEC